MRTIFPFSNVALSNPNGIPASPRYDGDAAMARFRDTWKILLDPAYPTPGGTRNLESNVHMAVAGGSAWDAGDFSTFPGGQPAFYRNDNLVTRGLTSPVAMNPTAWTAFFVVNSTMAGGGGSDLVRRIPILGDYGTGYSPRFVIRSAGNFAVFKSDSTIRAQGAPVIDGQTRLLMATFSVAEGIRIFYNGVIADYEPSQTQALDEGYGANEWIILRNNGGGTGDLKIGVTGILDVDLGSARYADWRVAIERHLMTKYGIV